MTEKDVLEEAEKLPLNQRLEHSNWKVRLNAYEILEKKLQEAEDSTSPIFNEYAPFMKKILSDKNAAALEKGLDVVSVWVDRYEQASKYAKEFPTLIIEKCLGNARQKTRDKGVQLLLLIMEIDVPDPVIMALIEGASSKVPKVAAASIAVITEALKTFGIRVFPVKQIFKVFLPWFESTHKPVREEAQNLTIELCRWLGEATIKKQIEHLRSAQIKELEQAFEKLPKEPPKALKYLRKDAPSISVVSASGRQVSLTSGDNSTQAPEQKAVDPWDLMEPVNILSKLPSTFYEGLASKKWKERKEELDKLVALADTMRLAPGDYTEVVKALKKCFGDANIRVVETAAKCLGLLGRGLRKDFAPHAKAVISTMFDKLKEKKPSTVTAIQEALSNMIPHCFTLSDIIEDIEAASQSKVPQAKKELLVFVTKLLKVTHRNTLQKHVKQLSTMFMTLLEDGDPEVRDACFESFGTLITIVGERTVQGYLAKLDKVKEKKLREFISATPPPPPVVAPSSISHDTPTQQPLSEEKKTKSLSATPKKGTLKSSSGILVEEEKSLPPPKVTAPKAAPSKIPTPSAIQSVPSSKERKTNEFVPENNAANNTNIQPAPSTRTASLPKPILPVESGDIVPSFSEQQAVERAESFISKDILSQLAEKGWKQRLEAVNALSDIIDKMNEPTLSANTEILMCLLYYRPTFSDINFQVTAKTLLIAQKIAYHSTQFTYRHAAYVIEGICDKLIDAKLKKSVTDTFGIFSEVLGPQTIFSLLYKYTGNHRNPKVTSEALLYMTSAIQEFGLHTVDVKGLMDFVKVALESTNPYVKHSAVALLTEMYRWTGDGLRDNIKDVKPTLLNIIDQEFEKIAGSKPSTPTRHVRSGALANIPSATFVTSSATAKTGEKTPTVQEDVKREISSIPSNLPRIDISSKITPQLLQNMEDQDWKKRQEALQQVEQILNNANKHIQPKLGGLIPALKKRLVDTNKNLTVLALNILGDLATAVGPAIESQMKHIATAILNNFTDNKPNVRQATTACLDKWVAEIGFDPFLVFLPNAMTLVNGRKDLLQWISRHFPTSKKKGNDIKPLIKPLFACLQDKAEVKALAETIFIEVVKRVGSKVIEQEALGLKTTFQQSIKALLAKINKSPSKKMEESKSTDTKRSLSATPKKVTTPSPQKNKKEVSPPKSSSTSASVPLPSSSPSTVQQPENKPPTPLVIIPPTSSNAVSLIKTNKKELRAAQSAQMKWFFDEPTEEHIAFLQEQMKESFAPELLAKLFTWNQYIDAIIELEIALGKYKDATIDNLDLLLKWITLRLFDVDHNVLNKVLEYLKKLISVLVISAYQLSDYEAACIVPVFITRIGFISEENSRNTMRGIFGQFSKVYPSSKLFLLVLEKLLQQNTDARLESLPQLHYMLRSQGISVCSPSTMIPILCQVLAQSTDDTVDDSNSKVREAILNIFLEIYNYIEKEIWKFIGDYKDAADLLATKIPKPTDQKSAEGQQQSQQSQTQQLQKSQTQQQLPQLKEVSEEKLKPTVPQLQVTLPPFTIPHNTFKLELDKVESAAQEILNKIKGEIGTSNGPVNEMNSQSSSRFLSKAITSIYTPMVTDLKSTTVSTKVEFWIREINSTDVNCAVEALKAVCNQLKENESVLLFYIDPLVSALTRQLDTALTDPILRKEPQQQARLIKYLVNTFLLLFNSRTTAKSISQSFLGSLMKELLQALLNESIVDLDDGKNIVKALNMVMIKLLDNSDRTTCFIILLQQLKESVPSLDGPPQSPSKLTDLIMKCLLKLTKVINTTIKSLHVDAILREIHLFLVTHPPQKWKDRDNTPLKTVKTLLNEIVKYKGEDIVKSLTLIPTGIFPPPIILSYIKLMLKNTHPNVVFELPNVATTALVQDPDQETLPLKIAEEQKTTPVIKAIPPPEYRLSPHQVTDEEAVKNALHIIFKKIANKETTRQGLVDLYWLKHDYPQIDIDPYIKKTNKLFQDYIERELKNLRTINEVNENNDPNKMVLSTDLTMISGSDLAASYLERLRNLQQRLGLKSRLLSQPPGTWSVEAPLAAAKLSSEVTSVSATTTTSPSSTTSTATLIASQMPIVPTLQPPLSKNTQVQMLRERLRAANKAGDISSLTNASAATLPPSNTSDSTVPLESSAHTQSNTNTPNNDNNENSKSDDNYTSNKLLQAPTNTTIQSLRERLAKIKQSALTSELPAKIPSEQ